MGLPGGPRSHLPAVGLDAGESHLLALLARSASDAVIGELLDLDPAGVEKRIASLARKLGATSRDGLLELVQRPAADAS